MSAKLYRVTVTQLYGSSRKADVTEWWIAATTAAQARKRALENTYIRCSPDRIHIHVSNWRGGHAHIKTTTLEAQP